MVTQSGLSLFRASLLVSTIAGTSTGVSSLFVKEEASAALQSVKAGTPSVGTMINFILIIGAGFTYLLAHPKHRKYLSISGAIILALATIALIGYAIDSPPLYYQVEGVSGAMALHTAIAFALLGISLILLAKPDYVERSVSKKSRSLKISMKLIFAFLISALFPIIVVGFISFDLAQTSLEKENFISLNEQADLQVERIEAFFFERRADAVVTSKIQLFKSEIPILDEFYQDQTNEKYIESANRVDQRIKLIDDEYGYDGILLLDPDGIIIYVSKTDGDRFVGLSMMDFHADAFTNGKSGVYVSEVVPDVGGDGLPDLFMSAPILDNEENLIGVLIFDIPIQRYLENILKSAYVGETGETGIAKKIGNEIFSLSPLRFDPDAAMKKLTLPETIAGAGQKAASGLDGTGIDFDYRGQEVLAAWRYIPSLDWGLVSKIDTAEALAPIDQLQRDITVLAIVFIVGIGFFWDSCITNNF